MWYRRELTQINPYHFSPRFCRCPSYATFVTLTHTRVVDRIINPTEPLMYAVKDCLDRRFICNIKDMDRSAEIRTGGGCVHLLQGKFKGRSSDIDQSYSRGAFKGESNSGGEAYTRRRSSYDLDAPMLECHTAT